jgi:hypothetical protein
MIKATGPECHYPREASNPLILIKAIVAPYLRWVIDVLNESSIVLVPIHVLALTVAHRKSVVVSKIRMTDFCMLNPWSRH